MKAKNLIYNARIYTQADNLVVDSLAFYKNRIVAVGNHLEYDSDFKSYRKINMKSRMVIPGLVDGHTHFYYMALAMGQVNLDGIDTFNAVLSKVKKFSSTLKKNSWVTGYGFSPDRLIKRLEPDRYTLDKVAGGRPVFIFSKDQHTAWVSSRALQLAGIDRHTPDPEGGEIVRFEDGTPNGILRENPGYDPVYSRIVQPSKSEIYRLFKSALALAYKKGITGVHSFDGPEAMLFFSELAEKNKLGLRINYYAPAKYLPQLIKSKIFYGTGTDFFRIAGIKIFADGSLGSQSAYCFNRYLGSKSNFGIETTTKKELSHLVKEAARIGMPCAIHAIGDRAISNVLDVYQAALRLDFGARHRIEHLQMIRPKDVARVKKLNVVASVQPSHCPSDIKLVWQYWGKRGANAYIFKTLIDKKIDVSFGSDVPIEPLDPLAGIAAAVRRAKPGSRDVFYSKQRISTAEALYRFTVGPAIAAGQAHCRGYLLPGYPADLVILDRDITKIAPAKIYDTQVLATILDGQIKYCHSSLKL